MQQSPSREASQEFPGILWTPKVHCLIHQNPQPVPNKSHINPVHTTTISLFKDPFYSYPPI